MTLLCECSVCKRPPCWYCENGIYDEEDLENYYAMGNDPKKQQEDQDVQSGNAEQPEPPKDEQEKIDWEAHKRFFRGM